VSKTAPSFWDPVGAAMYLTPLRAARYTLSTKGNFAVAKECQYFSVDCICI
jgi:hypothetical protein